MADGATILLEGGKPDGDSAIFAPTVLTDITSEMDVYRQELFGPVAMVFRARSEAEAVAIANDTPFGLGGSMHSDSLERAARVANQPSAGMVHINECGGTAPELPFGGIKRSGVGRELGRYGMEEFANRRLVKTCA